MTQRLAATGFLTADDDFNVRWQESAEANLCWVWDPGHFPFPFPPLAIDCGRMGAVAIAKAQDVPEKDRRISRFINGYWYMGQDPESGNFLLGGAEPSEKRKKQIAQESKDPWGHWKRVWEPEIRSLLDPIKSDDLRSVPYTEISDALERLFADSSRVWAVTMAAAQVMGAVSSPFVSFCISEFGDEGELLAATMLGGYSNYSTQSDLAIWKLARKLRDSPDPEQSITSVERSPESADGEIGKAVNEYLNHYGWRSSIWSDMATPVWRLAPAPFFDLLRRYVDNLPEDP